MFVHCGFQVIAGPCNFPFHNFSSGLSTLVHSPGFEITIYLWLSLELDCSIMHSASGDQAETIRTEGTGTSEVVALGLWLSCDETLNLWP